MAYVEELQFIDCAANAGGEEEDIALQPRHLDGGVFEASSGVCVAHDGGGVVVFIDDLKVDNWR